MCVAKIESATGILCDWGVPLELKDKIYWTLFRPLLLYASKCLAFRKDHSRKTRVAEMWMLQWMSRHTLRDIIRNKDIRNLGASNIEE